MRHKVGHRKLQRPTAHRNAMLRNMAASLIKHEQIKSTLPKVRELRPYVEKLITLAKKGGLSNRRLAMSRRTQNQPIQRLQRIGPPVPRALGEALRKPPGGRPRVIAEIKRHSPSAGVICADFDPVRIAREYEAAGASCLSVLTDEKFFQGSLAYLKQIRDAVNLPLLRKDFIIDELQILEAIEWGADAILLIVAILDDAQLRDYLALWLRQLGSFYCRYFI